MQDSCAEEQHGQKTWTSALALLSTSVGQDASSVVK